MEAFFWTMLGAFILGMTGLAYKQPNHYRRIYPVIQIALMLLLSGGSLYGSGYSRGVSEASSHFSEKAERYIHFDGSPFPFDGFHAWMLVAVLIAYLTALTAIPAIIGSSNNPEDR